MINSFGFILSTLLVLGRLCDGTYITESSTLQNYGILENVNNSNANPGDYYCQKYQSSVVADSASPTTLTADSASTYSQTYCAQFYKLQVDNTMTNKHFSVDLNIVSTPSDHTVSPLFAYKIGNPPLMIYDNNLQITFDSVQFDFNGKTSIGL